MPNDTSPPIGGWLGGTDVIVIQYPPNRRVNRKTHIGLEGGLMKGHLARASRHYDFICLKEPYLDPDWERARLPQEIQLALGHDVCIPLRSRSGVY